MQVIRRGMMPEPKPAKDYLLDPAEGHIIPSSKWPENRTAHHQASLKPFRSTLFAWLAGLSIGTLLGAIGVISITVTAPRIMDPIWTWVIQLFP